MHQPYYRDDISEETSMPWVRLHGIKNYYDIPKILTDYNLKMTFNLVPSLLKQIDDLVRGVTDAFEIAARTPAAELTDQQKYFILKNFFMVHPNLISDFPRYSSLWEQRGRNWFQLKDELNIERFNNNEYRDLQVLYHLSWSGWTLRKRSLVKELIMKGEDYSEEEKIALLDLQRDFIKEILPMYKRLYEEGKIEIATSPYYHPILPLLINPSVAEVSVRGIPLPKDTTGFPDDAAVQVRDAVEYFRNIFGNPPKGMWPSEGSVSNAVLELAINEGISWIATDDEILRRTLKLTDISEDSFLKSYCYSGNTGDISIFFRDHYLSDKIGFTYSKMDPQDAVEDFMLYLINRMKRSSLDNPLVCVILDGENAWEFFEDNGKDFLRMLTSSIAKADWIETITFSDYLEEFGVPTDKIDHIHPGSWIYANFNTWIGQDEKNRAWEVLIATRKIVEDVFSKGDMDENQKNRIMNEIYIAEGSDWFWWYGDDHHTEFKEEFDSSFRRHLLNVYKILEIDPPDELFMPIYDKEKRIGIIEPVSFINPVLDGQSGSFYEWRGCGVYNPYSGQGAIHKSEFHIQQIKFGFNLENLFLRFETSPQPACEKLQGFDIEIEFFDSIKMSLILSNSDPPRIFDLKKDKIVASNSITWGYHHVVEVGIKWDLLGVKVLQQINLAVLLKKDNITVERHPANSNIVVTVPDEDFERRDWIV
jgi:alpha-amylase/alpha-mannosidase (GH57 family)